MESREPKRRFPPPWRVERLEHGFDVHDANGIKVATVYCRDGFHAARWSNPTRLLTRDEARRIAFGIARLPELLAQRREFQSRGQGQYRWKPERPYHVALEDIYVRQQWDYIDLVCKMNGLPFNATGERVGNGALWCVYEFELQLDAIQFWDAFEGRWLRGSEFIYPDRPSNLPRLKLPTLKKSGRDNGWL